MWFSTICRRIALRVLGKAAQLSLCWSTSGLLSSRIVGHVRGHHIRLGRSGLHVRNAVCHDRAGRLRNSNPRSRAGTPTPARRWARVPTTSILATPPEFRDRQDVARLPRAGPGVASRQSPRQIMPPSRLSAISALKWRTTSLSCPQMRHAPSSGQIHSLETLRGDFEPTCSGSRIEGWSSSPHPTRGWRGASSNTGPSRLRRR